VLTAKDVLLCIVANTKNHLILNGRDPSFRVWKCLGDKYFLDEKQGAKFIKFIEEQDLELDL
jgi:hypothetical protein